jgi:pimeloyl-ACP methyl ester carboxylesterase
VRASAGAALALLIAAGAARAQTPVIETQPAIETPWTLGGLAGTLTQPQRPSRGPALLLIAGSGPTDRDGNLPGLATDSYRMIAQGLAASGLHSLRYDKRGIGGSRGLMNGLREDDIRLEHFVGDAVNAARALSERPDVSSLVIAGHSEGALVASLAAQRVSVTGIVLLAGAGRRADVIIREQIGKAPMPDGMRAESLGILGALVAGRQVPDVPPAHHTLFRPSIQPYLLSWFAADPAAALARLSAPAFIVHAERDIQVARADFDALAKARPDARVLLLPEANHVFKAAPADLSDRGAQVRSYLAPAALIPALIPAVIDFVRAVAR